jgi:hypothetical protein
MELFLNASALSPDALYISLSCPSFPNISLRALVDSGSLHCFIHISVAQKHLLPICPIPPIPLWLFDGLSRFFIQFLVSVPVVFSNGTPCKILFYVTILDKSASAVLGYDWLTRYNPLVDWSTGRITFQNSEEPSNLSSPLPASVSKDVDAEPSKSLATGTFSVSFIGAAAYIRACKLSGSVQMCLCLRAASADIESPPPDLSFVSSKYHEYAKVFNDAKANTLVPHRPYNLQIELDEDKPIALSPIYSLSAIEQKALQEFINKNVNSGFIRQSASPHGASILFVKKKDGSLRLCVDYRTLNKITKKDRYPLPLISNLLQSPGKACVYTKIDLWHVYHLVRIAKGNEWKTTFRTQYGSFEWLVMPFGLTNAPAAFQRFINDIFQDLLDDCVIVYLDNILIFSNDLASHRKHVKEVLC